MGHNPTKNPFRRARLGLDVDTQAAVDEYKARSIWGAWWRLDETIRRRYFTRPERDFVARWGAHMDELACQRTNPVDDREQHFVRVCLGHEQPQTRRERLWVFVQMVCRYKRAVTRAARADLAEHDAAALRAENFALKAKCDHLEVYAHQIAEEFRAAAAAFPEICNLSTTAANFNDFREPRGRIRFTTDEPRRPARWLLTPTGIVPNAAA